MRTTTLKELGYTLPLGIPDGDSLKRDFALRPYTMREEKDIARKRDLDPSYPATSIVTDVVASLLISLGGEDLSDKDEGERVARVLGLFFSDVVYIYMMARMEAVGKDVKFPFLCPHCRQAFSFEGDITTTEIDCVDTPGELEREVDLPVAWTLRKQQTSRLLLRATPWGSLHGQSVTAVTFKAASFQGSIVGALLAGEDNPKEEIRRLAITPMEVDTLTKRNINFLDEQVAKVNAGPSLIVQTQCPRPACNQPVRAPLGWDYDTFFG